MFRTMREAELMHGLIRPASGLQFWSLVELETVWPWFHVETMDCSGNSLHTGIVLAPNVELLRDLVAGGSKTSWVRQVQVVTPRSVNGTDSWKMEILESLHEVIDDGGQLYGHEYHVVNGAVYSTAVSEGMKSTRRLVYSSTGKWQLG